MDNDIAKIFDDWYAKRTPEEQRSLDKMVGLLEGSIKNMGVISAKVTLVYALLYRDKPNVRLVKG